MKSWTVIAIFILVSSLTGANAKIDSHTTLYAGFDKTTRQADYALGFKNFYGDGAVLVKGVKGNAIDLRMRPIMKNFQTECSDYTPVFTAWGFSPRGNIPVRQGTFECWFRVSDMKKDKRNIFGTNLIGAAVSRNFIIKEKNNKLPGKKYTDIGININQYGMLFRFSFLDLDSITEQIAFKNIPGFKSRLEPDQWHYFTMCWSPGELIVYLDGRPVKAWDITGKKGLVLSCQPARFISMSDLIIDELRISNNARYTKAFEPEWPDGTRPKYAFPGIPKVKRFPGKYEEIAPPTPFKLNPGPELKTKIGDFQLKFNRNSGVLSGLDKASPGYANGLMLWKGFERKPLPPRNAADWQNNGKLNFKQEFEQNISVDNQIEAGKTGTLDWSITLENKGKKEIYLEALLSLPVAGKVVEFFDGSDIKTVLHTPRHRDLYYSTLPYVAASSGKDFIGVGLNPYTPYSDLVGEWIPASLGQPQIRQGIKLALFPGEKYELKYRIIKGQGSFGCLDAVDNYHKNFPRFYRFLDDVTIYTYMPATQHLYSDQLYDQKRVGYAGSIWGHGPGHDKGDEWGSEKFWNRTDFAKWPIWKRYTHRKEVMWKNLLNNQRAVPAFYKRAYDNWYPVRRFHTCPDLMPVFYVNATWPGYQPNDDLLCFGQYYMRTYNWLVVNEWNTPVGKHILNEAQQYRKAMDQWSPGFINDMSHGGSMYRHNDPVAQKSPGRSFSRDLKTFVRQAAGRQARYDALAKKNARGYRTSFWSDGGAFSYSLCGSSAAIAIEGGGFFKDLANNGPYMEAARYLLGEKPMTVMTHQNDDWTGNFVNKNITPAELREYLRYNFRQLMLFCMRTGVSMDPATYNHGQQFLCEYNPALVESVTLGRRLIPAATVKEPLWLRRSGKKLDQLLIVGNQNPSTIVSDVNCTNSYYGGAPIWGRWLGGSLNEAIDTYKAAIKTVAVQPRTPEVFKLLGVFKNGTGKVSTNFTGDGLDMQVTFNSELKKPGRLVLNTFAPLYRIEKMTLNGKNIKPENELKLSAGRHQLTVKFHNNALDFTKAQWDKVQLIKNNKANFYLIADKGINQHIAPGVSARIASFQFGFEHGTAMMLSEFIHQYDTEDGIPDNMQRPELKSAYDPGYSGWAVELRENQNEKTGVVRIDPAKRLILVTGPTQGEMRRAMVVFMRMVDRKYPNIGRNIPLRYRKAKYLPGKKINFKKLCVRVQTRELYENLADKKFLYKPILYKEYENLYANDNMDFAGKYKLRFSPYIFEPTYTDDFVYGYKGGKAVGLKFKPGSPDVIEP